MMSTGQPQVAKLDSGPMTAANSSTILMAVPVETAAPATSSSAALVSVENLRNLGGLALVWGRSLATTAAASGAGSGATLGKFKNELLYLVDLRAYSRPASMEQAMTRVRANAATFTSTYTLVVVVYSLLFVLTNATLFLAIGALGGLWSWFLRGGMDAPTQIGTVSLGKSEKAVALGSATLLIVVFGGLISNILYIIMISAMTIAGHGSLREPVVLDELDVLAAEQQQIVSGDVV